MLLQFAFKKAEIIYDSTQRSPRGGEHSGEGIFGRRSRNAKLFERIEHSGSR